MYLENGRRSAARRSNDEFLRRMVGGELTANELPVINRPSPMPPNMEGGSCNSGDTNEAGECPSLLDAPSLAMVYAPRQCWRSLLDPDSALANGSLFAELVMPFEGCGKTRGMEGCSRK